MRVTCSRRLLVPSCYYFIFFLFDGCLFFFFFQMQMCCCRCSRPLGASAGEPAVQEEMEAERGKQRAAGKIGGGGVRPTSNCFQNNRRAKKTLKKTIKKIILKKKLRVSQWKSVHSVKPIVAIESKT